MALSSQFGGQLLDAGVALTAAYVLALPLAWERETRTSAPLGLRTLPLVSVGACAYVLISRYLYDQGIYSADGLARTLRALMTGIGFIGGGAIVKHVRDVRGIATGAAVWNTGAIGASVAHGLYLVALALSLANVLIFHLSRRVAEHRSHGARAEVIMLSSNNDHGRETLIRLLNARLADAIDLLYQAKQAHWNVTGREFYALHQLFEDISNELREHVDDIAERAVQLGGRAEGTIKMVAGCSSLPEYPQQIAGGAAHIEALSASLDAAAISMRAAIEQASSLGDEVTADIFVGATRVIDKLHWMVRAHGAEQPAPEAGRVSREAQPETSARQRH